MTNVIAAGGPHPPTARAVRRGARFRGQGGYDVTVRRVAIPPEDGSGRPAAGTGRRVPEVMSIVSGAGEFTAVPDLAGGTG